MSGSNIAARVLGIANKTHGHYLFPGCYARPNAGHRAFSLAPVAAVGVGKNMAAIAVAIIDVVVGPTTPTTTHYAHRANCALCSKTLPSSGIRVGHPFGLELRVVRLVTGVFATRVRVCFTDSAPFNSVCYDDAAPG